MTLTRLETLRMVRTHRWIALFGQSFVFGESTESDGPDDHGNEDDDPSGPRSLLDHREACATGLAARSVG
jgi:hypothetical protein